MKKLCQTLLKAFIAAVIGSQLASVIADRFSTGMILGKSTLIIIYSAIVFLVFAIDSIRSRKPEFPSRKLDKILESEGYSPKFYRVVQIWQEKCAKKGYVNMPSLGMGALLIDGGHYKEGFDVLSKIDFSGLSYEERQCYFNICLYGAVECGDRETADAIYRSGRLYLISAKQKEFSANIKHTLGCYEYLCGNVLRAEELFLQSLSIAKAADTVCADYIGLSVCYIDTDRVLEAFKAVECAEEYAVTHRLQIRQEKAKQTVKDAVSRTQKEKQPQTVPELKSEESDGTPPPQKHSRRFRLIKSGTYRLKKAD